MIFPICGILPIWQFPRPASDLLILFKIFTLCLLFRLEIIYRPKILIFRYWIFSAWQFTQIPGCGLLSCLRQAPSSGSFSHLFGRPGYFPLPFPFFFLFFAIAPPHRNNFTGNKISIRWQNTQTIFSAIKPLYIASFFSSMLCSISRVNWRAAQQPAQFEQLMRNNLAMSPSFL